MHKGNMLFGIGNIVIGCVVIALCIPLRKNKIRMNCWYGMRFRKSFESDEYWYKINRYGASRMIRWSAVLVVIGLVTFFMPAVPGEVHRFAPLILIIPVVETWIYTKRM